MVDEANVRLTEIEKEYNELKAQYDAKKQECDAVTFGSENWFEKSSKCNDELFDLETQISSLDFESSAINLKDYTVYCDVVNPMSYYVFYIIGGSVAGIAILAAFIIYLVKGKKTY